MEIQLPNGNLRKRYHKTIERYLALIQLEYYRYEVTFGPYVMTSSERLVTNIFLIFALLVLYWVVLLYFPRLLYQNSLSSCGCLRATMETIIYDFAVRWVTQSHLSTLDSTCWYPSWHELWDLCNHQRMADPVKPKWAQKSELTPWNYNYCSNQMPNFRYRQIVGDAATLLTLSLDDGILPLNDSVLVLQREGVSLWLYLSQAASKAVMLSSNTSACLFSNTAQETDGKFVSFLRYFGQNGEREALC